MNIDRSEWGVSPLLHILRDVYLQQQVLKRYQQTFMERYCLRDEEVILRMVIKGYEIGRTTTTVTVRDARNRHTVAKFCRVNHEIAGDKYEIFTHDKVNLHKEWEAFVARVSTAFKITLPETFRPHFARIPVDPFHDSIED